jgi:hypothetical protein
MNFTICYFSKSQEGLSNEEVEHIFAKAYTKNTLLGIKGVLLYMMGDFFQVLEGSEKAVKKVFETIKLDARHHTVFEIINKETDQPVFKDYSLDFNIVRTDAQIKEIKEYLRGLNHNTTAEKLDRLLKPFFLLV